MGPKYYPLQVKGVAMLVIRTEREDGKQVLRAIAPDGSEPKLTRAMAKRIAWHHEKEAKDGSN